MSNTHQLERDLANLDEQISSQVQMMSDKLISAYKIKDLEGDALLLTSLIEMRKQKVALISKARIAGSEIASEPA